MKCSWAKHKKLMEKEGFYDSENSESYRQMIKFYQKSIGELPSAPKYAEMVSESQLESIKEMVGELAWEKREIQHETKKLGKTRREIIDGSLFINEVTIAIKNVLSDINFEEIMNHTFSPVSRYGKDRMILCLTDWHIGSMVDVEDNQYNYSIAKRRIYDVVDQAINIAREQRVSRIDVVYCGDILEHAYMRDSQAYHAEFPVSRQMALAGRLMIDVLYKLSRNFHVTYRGFAGNHDRFNGKDKNGNIDGDTGMVIVNEMVQLYIENAGIENLVFSECHSYNAKLINVNGKNFKFVHGDFEKKADTGKLADHSFNDKIQYDVIVYGHFHHYMVLEVGLDRLEVRVGSTKGSDDYSEKLGVGSAPSQAVILVDEHGEIDVRRLRVH
ncbi:hypothetical protein [Peribacillus asahii]|uniref:hypothetical protein n=1 Tax=Peribacillus asahii TaxID=228899 RepID=UPI0038185CA8